VFVYTDYTIAVDAIRDEVRRVLQETPLWDGKAQGVQVTKWPRAATDTHRPRARRDQLDGK
jgi:hypothetical protein